MSNEFRAGAAMSILFVDSAGTIDFTSEYTNAVLKYEGDTIDVTSGNDTTKRFLSSLTSWSVSVEAFVSGTVTPVGTAALPRFAPHSDGSLSGTVIISPFGTATGKFRHLGGVVITSRELDYKFDDAATMSAEFQGSAALTEGVW